MKRNLGKIILIFLILSQVALLASEYTWSMESSKHKVMTGEAVYLKYTCRFNDESELYSIEFNPVTNNSEYRLELLSEKERIIDEKRVNTYEFVLFVKKAGKFFFSPETIIKKTNKDSIENSVLGRDNANYEEFSIKKIKQKKLSLNVTQSPENLVGVFTMHFKKESSSVKAFEPYHLEITIEGKGDFDLLKPIIFDINNTKVFASKGVKNIKLTRDGYLGSYTQKFAFVSEKDFKISSIDISYFDLQEKRVQHLQMPSIDVNVKSAYKVEELLDQDSNEEFTFKREWLYYLLVFILGYLTAKVKVKKFHKESKRDKTFQEKVYDSRDLSEFTMLLALHNKSQYEELLLRIEKGAINTLSDAKKEFKSNNKK